MDMKTFDAYRIESGDNKSLVWFDGEKIHATNRGTIRKLKNMVAARNDEELWHQMPHAFRSAYTTLHKTTVNKDGEEVKQ
jgi:hypothetical protein